MIDTVFDSGNLYESSQHSKIFVRHIQMTAIFPTKSPLIPYFYLSFLVIDSE